METAQAMVDAGRSNNLTKKNKTLGETEKKLNNLNYDLKKAVSEVYIFRVHKSFCGLLM